jgi:hypothetical protein
MSAPKKKAAYAKLSLTPPAQYFRSAMANRFSLQREEGFTIAHFGLVDGKKRLLEQNSFVFPAHSLENLKENLVQYSENLTVEVSKTPKWEPAIEGHIRKR